MDSYGLLAHVNDFDNLKNIDSDNRAIVSKDSSSISISYRKFESIYRYQRIESKIYIASVQKYRYRKQRYYIFYASGEGSG